MVTELQIASLNSTPSTRECIPTNGLVDDWACNGFSFPQQYFQFSGQPKTYDFGSRDPGSRPRVPGWISLSSGAGAGASECDRGRSDATQAASRMPPDPCSLQMASDRPPMSLGWASDGPRGPSPGAYHQGSLGGYFGGLQIAVPVRWRPMGLGEASDGPRMSLR